MSLKDKMADRWEIGREQAWVDWVTVTASITRTFNDSQRNLIWTLLHLRRTLTIVIVVFLAVSNFPFFSFLSPFHLLVTCFGSGCLGNVILTSMWRSLEIFSVTSMFLVGSTCTCIFIFADLLVQGTWTSNACKNVLCKTCIYST